MRPNKPQPEFGFDKRRVGFCINSSNKIEQVWYWQLYQYVRVGPNEDDWERYIICSDFEDGSNPYRMKYSVFPSKKEAIDYHNFNINKKIEELKKDLIHYEG